MLTLEIFQNSNRIITMKILFEQTYLRYYKGVTKSNRSSLNNLSHYFVTEVIIISQVTDQQKQFSYI